MIAESAERPRLCRWFTTLISKRAHLAPLFKSLENVKAVDVRTLEMAHGQKKSSILAWTFTRNSLTGIVDAPMSWTPSPMGSMVRSRMAAALAIVVASAFVAAQSPAPHTLDAPASDPGRMGWMVGAPPAPDKMIRFADGSWSATESPCCGVQAP